MPTFAELMQDADERGLIRKVKRASGFLAPKSVDLPESLLTSSGLIDLKAAGWLPIGIVGPEGWRFGRDVEKDEIDALGYASPVRTDITKVARSVTFNPLEYGRRHMLELRYGMDLSGVTPSAQGEIVFDEPDMPIDREWRLLVLADDGPVDENWLMGRGLASVKLSDASEEALAKEGAAYSGDLTLDIFTDDEVGTPVRHYLGGTGATKHADVLGFAA